MKNILVYLMLAATFLLSACDKDEKMLEPSYLPVTYANIAGTWQLAEWNGVEMSEGRYCYLVIKRKADEETGKTRFGNLYKHRQRQISSADIYV